MVTSFIPAALSGVQNLFLVSIASGRGDFLLTEIMIVNCSFLPFLQVLECENCSYTNKTKPLSRPQS